MIHWLHNQWPGRQLALLGLLAGLLLAAAACDFEQPVCASDSECRSGFVCSSSSGYCEPDWGQLADTDREDTVDAAPEDATDDVIDTTDEPDAMADPDTSVVPSACVGESTDEGCDTSYEPNDTQLDSEELTASAFGCPYGNGDFRNLDMTRSAGICGADTDDYYVLEYVPCRDRSFRIDVVVSPESSTCPHDAYRLTMEVDGDTYRCGPDAATSNGDARCRTLSDGRRQLTAFIESGRYQEGLATIHVQSSAEDGTAFFDYDLDILIE